MELPLRFIYWGMGVIGNGFDSKSKVLGSSPSAPTMKTIQFNLKELLENNSLQREIPLTAGIYLITNNINHKFYIGQSIRLRKRLKAHFNHYKIEKYQNPLYRAFNKYGLDNFKYSILETVPGDDFSILRKSLDALEIKYIKEFNSKIPNGYNQTFGEDGGINGYKFSEEQKDYQRTKRNEYIMNSEEYTVFVYNTELKSITKYNSNSIACKELAIKPSAHPCNYLLCYGKYIFARSEEELGEKIQKLHNRAYEDGKFKCKYSLEEYMQIKQDNPDFTFIELAEFMGVNKNTVYNYEHLLNPNFIIKKVFVVKVIDTINNTYKILNGELFDKLGFPRNEVYRKNQNLYHKRYKFIKLDINDLSTRIFGTEDYSMIDNSIIKHHFKLPNGYTITSIYDNLKHLNITDYKQID